MTAKAKAAAPGRRDFLRALVAGAAAVSTTIPSTSAHADSESDADKRKARYRATAHVQTYYRVNRYPS
jgi:hypothetical protein